jgi:hypothetical protein
LLNCLLAYRLVLGCESNLRTFELKIAIVVVEEVIPITIGEEAIPITIEEEVIPIAIPVEVSAIADLQSTLLVGEVAGLAELQLP